MSKSIKFTTFLSNLKQKRSTVSAEPNKLKEIDKKTLLARLTQLHELKEKLVINSDLYEQERQAILVQLKAQSIVIDSESNMVSDDSSNPELFTKKDWVSKLRTIVAVGVIASGIIIFIVSEKNGAANTNTSTNLPEKIESRPNIEFATIEGGFGSYSRSHRADYGSSNVPEFHATTEIKNNTSNKITSLRLVGFLRLQFQDEPEIFIPTPLDFFGENDNSEAKYLKNGILPIGARIIGSQDISTNNPWLPGQTLKFEFNIPGDGDYSVKYDLHESYFQRTPQNVLFVMSYKAITVDGEYKDVERVDVENLWQEYQKKLGLR